MKKKIIFVLIFMFLISVCMYSNFPVSISVNIYARSEPVSQPTEERKGAVLGPVTICAVFDTAYDHKPVVVMLQPTFEEGILHTYTLTSENPTISDKVAVGDYATIAMIADENFDYKNTGLDICSQIDTVSVVESPEGVPPSSVTLVADRAYVRKYGSSIVTYREENGKALSGVMSENDAYHIYQKEIAAQDISKGDSSENNNGDKNDSENPKIEEVKEPKHEEFPEEDEITEKEKKNITTYSKFIILAIIIFTASAIGVFLKKKQNKRQSRRKE